VEVVVMHTPTANGIEERIIEAQLPPTRRRLRRLDEQVTRFMESRGIMLLRLALGTVFVWFGGLKVAGKSPVERLASDTVYWLPAQPFVRLLGVWEMVIGIGLWFRVALRSTLLLFWVQMAGTFLVLLLRPHQAFQSRNPLLLTETGEFVIKNLVLIAAGLVVGSTVRHRSERVAA
jgi:uncharacterized membrane protein YkgB